METIIIELYLPGINLTCDVSMPSQVPVNMYLPELANTLQEVYPTLKLDQGTLVLSDLNLRCPLNIEKTLAENGIIDGSRLMLC